MPQGGVRILEEAVPDVLAYLGFPRRPLEAHAHQQRPSEGHLRDEAQVSGGAGLSVNGLALQLPRDTLDSP